MVVSSYTRRGLLQRTDQFGINVRIGHGIENCGKAFTGRATVAAFVLAKKVALAPGVAAAHTNARQKEKTK